MPKPLTYLARMAAEKIRVAYRKKVPAIVHAIDSRPVRIVNIPGSTEENEDVDISADRNGPLDRYISYMLCDKPEMLYRLAYSEDIAHENNRDIFDTMHMDTNVPQSKVSKLMTWMRQKNRTRPAITPIGSVESPNTSPAGQPGLSASTTGQVGELQKNIERLNLADFNRYLNKLDTSFQQQKQSIKNSSPALYPAVERFIKGALSHNDFETRKNSLKNVVTMMASNNMNIPTLGEGMIYLAPEPEITRESFLEFKKEPDAILENFEKDNTETVGCILESLGEDEKTRITARIKTIIDDFCSGNGLIQAELANALPWGKKTYNEIMNSFLESKVTDLIQEGGAYNRIEITSGAHRNNLANYLFDELKEHECFEKFNDYAELNAQMGGLNGAMTVYFRLVDSKSSKEDLDANQPLIFKRQEIVSQLVAENFSPKVKNKL